ncbi:MAG: hypothetical protein RI947_1511 [Candidatus Parcubacteria bacterium]|jgi:8-oxo-dGTP pyrophosphatase MutT (NUDIX family)
MTSIRAAAIILKDYAVLLMYRKREGHEYYVFPGGGVEKDETVEEAVLREVTEETTVQVKLDKLLYHHHYINDSDQYFYLCSYISGKPELGDANEKEAMKNNANDYYEPMWVPIEKIGELVLYPLELRDWLLEDIKDGFRSTPREASMRVEDIRQA